MPFIHRYIPLWPLPDYIFIPGVNPHPQINDPTVNEIFPDRPHENDFLKFSLDLFNHQYFWESHVYFEALWNTHQRKGSVALFCKAMIKLGAAGVKFSQHQSERGIWHLQRAKELFLELEGFEGKSFLGFDLLKIILNIDSSMGSDKKMFQVHFITFLALP